MTERKVFVVDATGEGDRLDAEVARHFPLVSRAVVRKLIDEGQVLLNGRPGKPARHVMCGDRIEVMVPRAASLSAVPENIDLAIVFENDDLAVIDKPAGMVVHPAPGHERGTVSNALMARFPHLESEETGLRPGIVHRLDKNTSGLMVVALNAVAHRSLQQQIQQRTLDRRYLALVSGTPAPDTATIRAPIGRDLRTRNRMAVFGAASRAAETSYRTLERFERFALIEAKLHTGRTHQIRVHLASIGHPIAGDVTYGGVGLANLNRQFLHAYRLTLTLPASEDRMSFESALPAELQKVLKSVSRDEIALPLS